MLDRRCIVLPSSSVARRRGIVTIDSQKLAADGKQPQPHALGLALGHSKSLADAGLLEDRVGGVTGLDGDGNGDVQLADRAPPLLVTAGGLPRELAAVLKQNLAQILV